MTSSPLLLPEDTIERLKFRDAALVGAEKDGARKSTTSRSVSTASSASIPVRYISVPTQFESVNTYEFVGLTKQKAQELFKRRHSKEQELKISIDFQDWIIRYIVRACRDGPGVRQEIQDAILREEHATIRGVQSLSAWLREIFETGFIALVHMNARILQELGQASEPHLRGGGDDDKSTPDFADSGVIYFTHQLWVAKYYAAIIWDACPVADRRTLVLHVLLSHLDAMKVWHLEFKDPDFKKLLYHSRRQEELPKELDKKRAHWENITEKHQLQEVEIIEDKDGKKEENMKVGRQWVWIEEAKKQLEEDCKNKAFILHKPHSQKPRGRYC
ncbi:hypothetical protein BDW02DRAFT_590163 [Decorospora gaudefroyi]|uniref:Uncharacterized protein n=1 Tax=Decorospora gaudefroyi TaxID=184978 RepID=A0A6A5K9W0_9PLEO|nr:hypothetical protein BDW02DRAFT_590163 [Decorospora gaudefroyi]